MGSEARRNTRFRKRWTAAGPSRSASAVEPAMPTKRKKRSPAPRPGARPPPERHHFPAKGERERSLLEGQPPSGGQQKDLDGADHDRDRRAVDRSHEAPGEPASADGEVDEPAHGNPDQRPPAQGPREERHPPRRCATHAVKSTAYSA